MLLGELGYDHPTPMVVWCDNLGAIVLSNNPTLHFKSKHFAMNFHFVWERVAAKTLQVRFVTMKDQATDILTKALPRVTFQYLESKLTTEVPIGLRGRIKELDK